MLGIDIIGNWKCIRLTHSHGCVCKTIVGFFWVFGFRQANGKDIALTSRISNGSHDCIFAHLHTNQPTIIELPYEFKEI